MGDGWRREMEVAVCARLWRPRELEKTEFLERFYIMERSLSGSKLPKAVEMPANSKLKTMAN